MSDRDNASNDLKPLDFYATVAIKNGKPSLSVHIEVSDPRDIQRVREALDPLYVALTMLGQSVPQQPPPGVYGERMTVDRLRKMEPR